MAGILIEAPEIEASRETADVQKRVYESQRKVKPITGPGYSGRPVVATIGIGFGWDVPFSWEKFRTR